MKKEVYRSRVYTERPAYADFDAPAKFTAIQSIIAKHLYAHPNAICSYSGGSDSDIMVHLIERTRRLSGFPPIKYVFFNTGLEMKAIKDHVKYTSEKYGIEIEEVRPKIGIVQASRKYGIPFVSKIMSAGLEGWQKKGIPLSIAEEYENAEENGKQMGHLCDEITIQRGSLMELVNQLCMEYLHTNIDKSSGDVGYQLGMKDGISGIREYICKYIYNEETL